MFEETLIKGAKENLALLGRAEFLKDAYLAGGTAVALQLGHRISVDFDFFTSEIQEKVDKQLGFLLSNPDHPSLKLHPIRGTKGIGEGYVDQHYRLTLEMETGYYILRKVGSHDILKNP